MNRRHDTVKPQTRHRGVTLFEVLIALAIFVGSFAAIGHLMSMGLRASQHTRWQSQAVIRCETLASELLLGRELKVGSSAGQFPDNLQWKWRTNIQKQGHLLHVKVTTFHASGSQHTLQFLSGQF